MVHDAARSLATTTLAKSVVEQLVKGEQAVIPALDVIDTVKEVDANGYVRNTLNRSSLRAVQTPQGFTRSVLARAHEASDDATDDAALVEALGVAVKLIAGEERALKITNPAVFTFAKVSLSICVPDAPAYLASETPKLLPKSPREAADKRASQIA